MKTYFIIAAIAIFTITTVTVNAQNYRPQYHNAYAHNYGGYHGAAYARYQPYHHYYAPPVYVNYNAYNYRRNVGYTNGWAGVNVRVDNRNGYYHNHDRYRRF